MEVSPNFQTIDDFSCPFFMTINGEIISPLSKGVSGRLPEFPDPIDKFAATISFPEWKWPIVAIMNF